jgi:hypothetical protein
MSETKDGGPFSPQQLSDWKRYERVRQSGRLNMLFPGARMATGLSEDRYTFVLSHYSELRAELDKPTTERPSS